MLKVQSRAALDELAGRRRAAAPEPPPLIDADARAQIADLTSKIDRLAVTRAAPSWSSAMASSPAVVDVPSAIMATISRDAAGRIEAIELARDDDADKTLFATIERDAKGRMQTVTITPGRAT